MWIDVGLDSIDFCCGFGGATSSFGSAEILYVGRVWTCMVVKGRVGADFAQGPYFWLGLVSQDGTCILGKYEKVLAWCVVLDPLLPHG